MRRGRLADLGGFRDRDANRQDRARTVRTVLRLDATPLGFDKAAANRQPEAGPGAAAILGLNAIELVEDPFEIARRDAGSLIDNLDRDDIPVLPCMQIDAAAGGCVLGRIIEQIEQYLLEQDRIEAQHR